MDNQLRDALERRLSVAPFLNLGSNPVLLGLEKSADVAHDSARILAEYSFLPGVIAELLSRGVTKLYEWLLVRDELLRNLGEELGTKSDGMSHFAILKHGLTEEVGIQLSADRSPSPPTVLFIHALRSLISETKLHAAAGALYALEDSAVPELKVVAHLVNVYSFAAIGRKIVSERFETSTANGDGWSLNRFFTAHIADFEVGHRDFLATALDSYLQNEADRCDFVKGFEDILRAMEVWWTSLAHLIPEERSSEKTSAEADARAQVRT